MKRLLYIAFKDFSNLHFGANAKVLSQCRAFEEYGYSVELIGRMGTNTVKILTDGTHQVIGNSKTFVKDKRLQNLMLKRAQMKCIEQYCQSEHFDACYIRYDFSDPTFIAMLKSVKQVCNKVGLELPTYPYEAENNVGALNKIKMYIDKRYRVKMHKYVDFIVTFYDGYKTLFDIPVIVVPNGFDFSTMQLVKTELTSTDMHIIAVSSMREWHGYERMIEGMYNYYLQGGKENFILHLVGSGKEYSKYRSLIDKYSLAQHFIMEGAMHGEKLNLLYEKCVVGVDSLARHRSGITVLSSLKSREYGAKGLPIINSCKIDIIEDDFPYMLRVPEDETPIDMNVVAQFIHCCFDGKSRLNVAKVIRDYIEDKCSMKKTLLRVKEGFEK